MSRYNAQGKQESTMKKSVNKLLQKVADANVRALVVDAETLLSSQALVDGGAAPDNVIVINSNKHIVQAARGKGHAQSVHGISTKVLTNHVGPFDIIYLDYCGTPDVTWNGFNPAVDFWWASANMALHGFAIATFSKRTSDPVNKARTLAAQANMTIVYENEYFETCAMYMMIMTKMPNAPLRCLFESIYDNTYQTASPKVVKSPKATKPKVTKPKVVKKLKVKKTPARQKYQECDRVGVNYRMRSIHGELRMFKATVLRVRTSKSGVYQYFLGWDGPDRSTWLNQDNITRKLYGRQATRTQAKRTTRTTRSQATREQSTRTTRTTRKSTILDEITI